MSRAGVSLWLLALLAFSLPFEALNGLRLAGGLVLTNVEAALAAYLVVSWSARAARNPRPAWSRPCAETWAILLWLLLLVASALASMAPLSSLKFAARLALGPLVFWTAGRDLGVPWGRGIVVGAVLCGGVLAAAAGLVEMHRVVDLSPILTPFRHYVTTDQGVLRLTGPFQHANLAAGTLAVLLPVALSVAALQVLGPRGATLSAAPSLASCPFLCWALVATISRAGVAAGMIGASVTSLALFAALPRRLGLRVAGFTAAGFAIAALFSSGIATAIRVRVLGLPPNLHGVAYAVEPSAVALAGTTAELPVVLRNTGFLSWRHRPPNPVRLGYHWVDSRGRTVVFEGARTSLPRDVLSGEEVIVRATVWTPAETGEYLLLWDLVHERVTWFSQRGNPAATTFVNVVAEAAGRAVPPSAVPAWTQSVATEMAPWGFENQVVPRRRLWSIALSQAAAHPLLGIGPGRFGATYGADLAPGRYDPGLSAHNLYLELAATTGVLGLAAFLALLAALARGFLSALFRTSVAPSEVVWPAAGLGVLAAFLTHGLLDCFLASYAVSLGFWIALSVCRAPLQASR